MEIIIETERRLTIKRREQIASGWCAQCAESTDWITPEEAVPLLNLSSRAVYQRVETGQAHFRETSGGFLFVCLNSLTSELRKQITLRLPVADPSNSPHLRPLPLRTQPALLPGPVPSMNGEAGLGYRPASSKRRKDRKLDQAAFDALLARLDADAESAAGKYVAMCQRLSKFFECRGCDAPQDLADETINRVARRLAEGEQIRADDAAPYFYGVARNVLREWQENRARQLLPLSDLNPAEHPRTDPQEVSQQLDVQREKERRLECLAHCLRELPDEVRDLLLEYYCHQQRARIENRKQIASRLGITVNALKIRLHRLRTQLERKISERLQTTAK
jgi:RNA polymerase sigma factor (sigma-70 family)